MHCCCMVNTGSLPVEPNEVPPALACCFLVCHPICGCCKDIGDINGSNEKTLAKFTNVDPQKGAVASSRLWYWQRCLKTTSRDWRKNIQKRVYFKSQKKIITILSLSYLIGLFKYILLSYLTYKLKRNYWLQKFLLIIIFQVTIKT